MQGSALVGHGGAAGAGAGGDLADPQAKLNLIDNLLCSSPPLPAPPAMQQAQIQATERELERQLAAMQQAHTHAADSTASTLVVPNTQRPSTSAGIKPLVIKGAVPITPPPAAAATAAGAAPVSALAAQLRPRLTQTGAHPNIPPPHSSAAASAGAASAAASSDMFAKVEVPQRAQGGAAGGRSGIASSFAPSSLAAALSDSGLLFGRPHHNERHAAVRRDGGGTMQRMGGHSNGAAHERGHSNGPYGGTAATTPTDAGVTLTIFLHPYTDVTVRPCRVLLALPSEAAALAAAGGASAGPAALSAAAALCNPTADDVLCELLRKWSSGELMQLHGLLAALSPTVADGSAWALHMVDEDTVNSDDDTDTDEEEEDESDSADSDGEGGGSTSVAAPRGEPRLMARGSGSERGMPEEDLPPLDRSKPVKSFGTTTLAMVCLRKHIRPPTALAAATAATAAGASNSALPNGSAKSSLTITTTGAASSAAASSAASSATPSPRPPLSPHTAGSSHSTGARTSSPASAGRRLPSSPRLNRGGGGRPVHSKRVSMFVGTSAAGGMLAAAAAAAAASNGTGGVPSHTRTQSSSVVLSSPPPLPAAAGIDRRLLLMSSQQSMSSDPSRHSLVVPPAALYAAGIGGGGYGGPLGPPSTVPPPLPSAAASTADKFYLKVHIGDHESHILGMLKSQLLAEVLGVLSRKKQALVALKPDAFRFVYLDPLVQKARGEQLRDMARIRIGELASDELILLPKFGVGSESDSLLVGGTGVGVGVGTGTGTGTAGGSAAVASPEKPLHPGVGGVGAAHHPHTLSSSGGPLLSLSLSSPSAVGDVEAPDALINSFHFQLATAGEYTEYRVIKTNQRGKRQARIFGMDRHRIYNKTQSGGGTGAEDASGAGTGGGGGDGGGFGVFSFLSRAMAADPGVSRAHRDINTIASVHVVSLRPTCFCIAFKESAARDAKVAQTREYELETRMECAEIVAKLRFLMAHAQAGTSNTATISSRAAILS